MARVPPFCFDAEGLLAGLAGRAYEVPTVQHKLVEPHNSRAARHSKGLGLWRWERTDLCEEIGHVPVQDCRDDLAVVYFGELGS
jgi:hypothetical protein